MNATVRHRDTGEEETIRAQYLVAADGAHSPIRERLGIPLHGHGSFSNSITIYFRADVKPLLRERNLSVIYVFGPRLQGFFRFSLAGDAGFLVVNKAIGEGGELSADLWEDTGERSASSSYARRSAIRRSRSRSRTCSAGTRAPSGPSGSRQAASS